MVLMVRRRCCAVSNLEEAVILRDAAKRPLLGMRTETDTGHVREAQWH
jgi:hypothetical protein